MTSQALASRVVKLGADVTLRVSSDHVAHLNFDRPPLNFLDANLVATLARGCRQAEQEGARAVVLSSTGKVFCAGADFGATVDPASVDPMGIYVHAVELLRQSLPMVVAVQGAAIGGGLGLALVGDFRVASPQARFAANFTALGIHPGFGTTVTLPRIVGAQAATDLFLTGRRVHGEEAHRMGLIDRLVDDPLSAALDLAAQIAVNAPLATRSARVTLRAGLADAVETAVRHEAAEQVQLFATDDFAEGVRAVAERREGRFAGR